MQLSRLIGLDMKIHILTATLLLLTLPARAQVGIGTATPAPSAQLDVVSTNKGLLTPRVASTTAVTAPVEGLLVYQTGGTAGFYYYTGAAWVQLAPKPTNALGQSIAFIHTAKASNTTSHITTLSYASPSQNDIILVTHNYNPPGAPSAYLNRAVGVYWTGSAWAIYTEDLSAIVNTSFNVLVIKN
ncbi:hypothetical protein GCM10028773_12220 [Spirosoma koreense]